jgi:hypothetical protein
VVVVALMMMIWKLFTFVWQQSRVFLFVLLLAVNQLSSSTGKEERQSIVDCRQSTLGGEQLQSSPRSETTKKVKHDLSKSIFKLL